MRRLGILWLSLSCLAAAAADEPPPEPFMEGQRLFQESRFAEALVQFEEANLRYPDEPRVLSWLGASQNQLGRHAEAKASLERAFALLHDQQALAEGVGQPVTPIDLNYHALLAGIETNLGQFEEAVATLQAYTVADDGTETAAAAAQALDGARAALKSQIVAAGAGCLRSRDLDCARRAFAQAEILQPATPPVVEAIARGALSQAERAVGETDEDKATRVALYEQAVDVCRLWLEAAGAGSTEARRVLAKALAGSKKPEAFREAIEILTSLWDGAADPAQRDGSIQLELAAAHAALEQWQPMLASASAFIEHGPEDPLGQGYCLRSFAQYRLGQCEPAIADGERCRNTDGTTRTLRHVDACKERLAKQQAEIAAANREAVLRRDCTHLYDRIKWVRNSLEVPIEDLVELIDDLGGGEARCASYLEEWERKEAGHGFAPAAPELCGAGVRPASSPLNLSARSREQLEQLLGQTRQFLELCRPSLAAGQIQAVEGGMQRIQQALDRPQ